MDVSKNSGFSIINHPFWDTPIFGNTPMAKLKTNSNHPDILGVLLVGRTSRAFSRFSSGWELVALVGLSVNRPYMKPSFQASNICIYNGSNGIQQCGLQIPPGPDLMNAFGRQIAARNNSNSHNPQTEVVYVQVKICKWFNKSCRMAVTSKQWHYLTRVWLIRFYIHN